MADIPPDVPAIGDPADWLSGEGWRRLTGCVGEGPAGWRAVALANPQTRAANHAFRVIPPSGGGGYLLKIMSGESTDRAAELIAGHWAAERRLAGHATNRVPRLLGVAPPDNALLMEFVAGRSLQDLLRQAPDAGQSALTRCAHWLQANMEADGAPPAPLPVAMIGQRLARLQQRAEARRPRIWRADAFDRLVVLARDALAHLSDRPLPMGARHGDANPGNFLLSDDGAVHGLDLLRPVPQHVCHDVAYLLARALPHLPPGSDLRALVEVEGDMARATTLLLRLEVLGLWHRLPQARFEADEALPQYIRTLVEDDRLADLTL